MATIRITHKNAAVYEVTVDDGRGSTTHEVTVRPSDVARYAPDARAERLLEASFEFLLEREPKESILARSSRPPLVPHGISYAASTVLPRSRQSSAS
jgi:hypothetical protein